MSGVVQSDLEIANIALTNLGDRPLQSLQDNHAAVALFNTTYAPMRDNLLRGFTWNFAIERTSVSEAATPPAWGFLHAYPMDDDWLRLLEVEGDRDFHWRVEGRRIVCNHSSPVNIRVIKRITDPTCYDPQFVTALAAMLAGAWVEPLSKSPTLREAMIALFREALAVAASTDSVEKTQEVIDSDDWVRARWRGAEAVNWAKLPGDPDTLVNPF